ncbi:MAG: polysaccharide deacetylase [Anaerolinea sp.]|nr:polysaccharide deacetylase [Anaerolinea sp.]
MSPDTNQNASAATVPFAWPPGYRAAAAFTFDVDAESAILAGAPEAARRLSVMTHQAYGPRTGVPRLLRILDRQGIRATFFIPGYTAERWPVVVRSIRDAGHEIAHHGYLHEPVSELPPEEEERLLLRGLEALDRVAGVRPVGWRAPMWEASGASPGILARHGFRYDSSLMDADHPYRVAAGPEPGAPSIIELPVHWGLDDWEQYIYLPGLSGSGLIESPTKVLELWTLELDALVTEGGLFVLTNHPFASGRPSRAAALERLMDHARSIDGLWIATAGEIAAHAETLPLTPVFHDRPALP